MKKLATMVSALVLCVALGGVAVATAAKKPVKVKTKVSVQFKDGGLIYGPYFPYFAGNPDTFQGSVKAKKGCNKGRKVTVTRSVGSAGFAGIDTKSKNNGSWSATVPNVPAGDYKVTVKKKKITKGKGDAKQKITCKKGSKTITL